MDVEKKLKKKGINTEEYPSLQMSNIVGHSCNFAKKSKFYKKIMQDGYFYNPYVHRRWLPYQFMRFLYRGDCWTNGVGRDRVDKWIEGVERIIKFNITEKRKIEIYNHEREVQLLLKAKDYLAYRERSKAFNIDGDFFKEFMKAGAYFTLKHYLMFMPSLIDEHILAVFGYSTGTTKEKLNDLRAKLLSGTFDVKEACIILSGLFKHLGFLYSTRTDYTSYF